MYEWDWQGAETEFNRAIEFRPNSALARAQYALFLDAAGRNQEAQEQERMALQLDPLSLIANTNMGDILAQNKQLDQAMQQYLMVIRIDPRFGDAHAGLAMVYARQERFADAIKELQTALEYDPDPQYRGWIAWVYAISGQKERARQTLQELNELSSKHFVPASISAAAFVALGEKEKAIAALEKGLKERDSELAKIWLDLDDLDSLRSDPRFERLLQVIGIH